jgi:hypothetical protein
MMLKTVHTILTKDKSSSNSSGDHNHESNRKGNRAAHFVNGYIKKERKKKRKELDDDENSSRSSGSRGKSTALTYHLMYVPRILKHDLRRQYPIMFAHVCNACDPDLMMKFIYQFCDPIGVTVSDSYDVVTARAQGIDGCKDLWTFRMNDAADQCFELQSIQIRVRSDGTCICEAKHTYTGTAIIHVNPKKIPRTLNNCKVNENGILVLPNLPSPENCVKESPKSATIEEEEEEEPSNLSSSVNDELLVSELKDLLDIDQHIVNEFVHSLQEEGKKNAVCSSLEEENEYLFSIFTDFMNPARSTPRMPDIEDTLALGFPYKYEGGVSFHLNEESKIYHVELRSNLITKK